MLLGGKLWNNYFINYKYEEGVNMEHLPFENEIKNFETEDKNNPAGEGIILFTGSSSITIWDSLKEDMKPLDVVNRGFGGSQMADLLYYAKRIILPLKPERIVIYEGDNDIACGTSLENIIYQTKELIEMINTNLPKAEIYLLSVKLSPSRQNLWELYKSLNMMLQKLSYEYSNVHFIDVCTPMLDSKGNAKEEFYTDDMLHMNTKGYELWTSVIKKILNKNSN